MAINQTRAAVYAAAAGRMPIRGIRSRVFQRDDLGDLGELVERIRKNGLMFPILVDDGYHLISGERRLAALRILAQEGHPGFSLENVPVLATGNIYQIVAQMAAERAHGPSKPMRWTEIAHMQGILREISKPDVYEIRRLTLTGQPSTAGLTKWILREALDLNSSMGDRIGSIYSWYMSSDPEKAAAGALAMESLDAGDRVTKAWRVMTDRRSSRDATRLGGASLVVDLGSQRSRLAASSSAMDGIATALRQIGDLHPGLTREECKQYSLALGRAQTQIGRLRGALMKKMKEEDQQ